MVFHHRSVYKTPSLLTTDGEHLSQSRKKIFTWALTGLTERALNQISRGKGVKPGLQEISLGVAHQGLYHFLQLPERRLQPGRGQHLLTDNKGQDERKWFEVATEV